MATVSVTSLWFRLDCCAGGLRVFGSSFLRSVTGIEGMKIY